MFALRVLRGLAPACVLAFACVAIASAAWGGTDPPRNTPIPRVPSSCNVAPTGTECINAAVSYLDKARASVGLPPYALPADFPSLRPERQVFILTNLDRIAYGIPPMPGMTAALNHDALVKGVWRADDPYPSNTARLNTWWPGWAGAFYNAPMAYEGWVWDDGLGSNNPRCTPTDHSRCWGHRHSVLWRFPAGSVLAMGAAAGHDSRHRRGYAYIFVGGNGGYKPTYVYTWKQALADGAGTNTYDPGTSPLNMCHVPVVWGMTLAQAQRALTKSHCTLGDVVYKHAMYVADTVSQQHPMPDKTIPAGSPVSLTISLGPP